MQHCATSQDFLLLKTLDATSEIFSLAFAGQLLAAGCDDNRVRVYDRAQDLGCRGEAKLGLPGRGAGFDVFSGDFFRRLAVSSRCGSEFRSSFHPCIVLEHVMCLMKIHVLELLTLVAPSQ